MPKRSFNSLLDEIRNCSPQERERIKKELELANAIEPIQDKLSEKELKLYQHIIRVLQQKHQPFLPRGEDQTRYPRMKGFNSADFKEGFEILENWMEEVGLKPKGPYLLRFYNFVAITLIDDCQRNGHPLSLKSIQQSLLEWPNVVEDAFPGYARAGLLQPLLRNQCQKL